MEFLLVGDSKLKIVLTDSDMKNYGIEAVNPDCTDSLCRRAVWSILDEAKKSVGFDPDGDKVLVQFYPLKASGCEVFVTKLGILSGTSAKIVSKSERIDILSREMSLYAFGSLEDLKLALKAIVKTGNRIPRCDVYLGEGDNWFLTVEEYGKRGESTEFPCILEFGRSLPKDFSVYIIEHAEHITDAEGLKDIFGA